MEERVDISLDTDRPWQADLCQFFTREKVAELCLRHVNFPKNLLSMRLLEPAAGHGAFFLPLLAPLVRSCRRQKRSFDVLRQIVRAYEIDPQVAIKLRLQTERTFEALGVDGPTACHIARAWIRNEDFLEARPRTRFTHIVGILLIFAGMPYRAFCVNPISPGSLRSSSAPTCTLLSSSTHYHCSTSTASSAFYAPERGRVTFMAAPCAKPYVPWPA